MLAERECVDRGPATRAGVHHVPRRWVCAALGTALAAALGGCGDGRGNNAGQVVARVNGADITVHQLDSELSILGVRAGSRDDRNARRVIEGLVDQQLLVREATETRLDRDPQVLLVMERARRQVLSEAFLERNLKLARPEADEVKTFYLTHAELFQKRRIYSFHDYLIERAELPDGLRPRLESAKTRADAEAVLKAANVSYRAAASTRSAEQLPLEMLPRISAMAKGEFFLLETGGTVILMQLADFTEQPVTLEQATPYIEQYLVNARKKELTARKLRELRASARIAYLAQDGDGPRPEASPRAVTGQPAQGAEPANEFIKRGVQGLAGK
jgi:EpsD family peptidyl-prolyl cis-trans isomerase